MPNKLFDFVYESVSAIVFLFIVGFTFDFSTTGYMIGGVFLTIGIIASYQGKFRSKEINKESKLNTEKFGSYIVDFYNYELSHLKNDTFLDGIGEIKVSISNKRKRDEKYFLYDFFINDVNHELRVKKSKLADCLYGHEKGHEFEFSVLIDGKSAASFNSHSDVDNPWIECSDPSLFKLDVNEQQVIPFSLFLEGYVANKNENIRKVINESCEKKQKEDSETFEKMKKRKKVS